MSRHNDYDAHRHLSNNKQTTFAHQPKPAPKSLLVGTVLTWMACAVIAAAAFYFFRSAI